MSMAKKSSTSSIEWNRVTWYSKLAALFLFLFIVPVLAFYVGTQYERTMEVFSNPQVQTVMPVMHAPMHRGY